MYVCMYVYVWHDVMFHFIISYHLHMVYFAYRTNSGSFGHSNNSYWHQPVLITVVNIVLIDSLSSDRVPCLVARYFIKAAKIQRRLLYWFLKRHSISWTMVQKLTCCLTLPSHYLNQRRRISSGCIRMWAFHWSCLWYSMTYKHIQG